MINSVQGLIYEPTAAPSDVVMDSSNIYTVNSTTLFRKYDQATLTNTLTVNATSSTSATGVALINSASAVVSCTSANLLFIELSTGHRSTITTNAAATQRSTAMQQIATNQSTLMGIATKSTTGSVTLINGNTFALSSLSVTGLTSQNATCTIAKTDSNNFFIGTTDSKVYEIDTTGAVIKSLTLPITNKYGGALSSLQVGSMAYYNNYLLVSDTGGIVRLYDWSQGTPLLVDQYFCTAWNFNQQIMLSNAASGTCYMTTPQANNLYNHSISEVYFEKGEILIESCWTGMFNSTTVIGTAQNTSGKMAMITTGTTSPAAMRVFNTTSPAKTSVLTRAQDPPGLDIPARVIRIRDAGIGRTFVESDITIAAGASSYPCTADRNYIELSLLTSPDKWDIREFKS